MSGREDIKIVAVDLDGLMCEGEHWSIEECRCAKPNLEILKKVNDLYMKHFVIIYTARKDELIPVTLEWLRRNNVRYNAISNLKMPADIYYDDKMKSL